MAFTPSSAPILGFTTSSYPQLLSLAPTYGSYARSESVPKNKVGARGSSKDVYEASVGGAQSDRISVKSLTFLLLGTYQV